MPQEDKSLNDIIERLRSALEKQVGVMESSTEGLISNITSSNAKFSDELDTIKGNILNSIQSATSGGNLDLDIDKSISLSSLMGDTSKLDNLNIVLGLKFLKVKRNILKSVDKVTAGGNLDLEIDKKISLSDLLGESPKLNIIHAFRWLRIKKNILKKVEKATESVELEIDPKMSLSDVLGSTPDQDIITKTRFFLIRQGLLNKISKAAKDFDPQESISSITGAAGAAGAAGLGGAAGAAGAAGLGGAAGAADEAIPSVLNSISSSIIELWSDISEPIISSSESLKILVENSSGDVLQQRENRKEDISRQERQIQALNAISDNDTRSDGIESEKSGGILNSIKEGLKSKIGLGGKAAGKGASSGIGGAMAGIGKGAGKGISGFLTGLGRGLKAISNPKYLIGAGVLIALGGALIVTAKGLKEFVGIDFKQVALGVTTLGVLGAGAALLGKLGPQILIGSLAIAALGASLIPAAFAFNMFSDINWKSVAIGIGTLTALGAAAFGLSFISPAIFIGAAAIAALGASMIPAAFAFDLFGKALATMTPFITVFGDAISTVIGAVGDFLTGFIDNLVSLSSAGPGLIAAGAGIAAVSAALIAFGASSALGGILSFFGGDPIKKFIELGKIGDGLDKSAKSIDAIAVSLEKLDSDKIKDIGKAFKPLVKQLKKISKLDLEDAANMFKFMAKANGIDISETPVPAAGEQVDADQMTLEPEASKTAATPILSSESKPLKVEIIEGEEEYSQALGNNKEAEDNLEAFENDSSKKYTMRTVEPEDDWMSPYQVKQYENPEDQKKYDSLKEKSRDSRNFLEKARDNYLEKQGIGRRDRGKNLKTIKHLQEVGAIEDDTHQFGTHSPSGLTIKQTLDKHIKDKFIKIQELKKSSSSIKENIDPIDNSTGAELDVKQRQINQMKEAETLESSGAGGAGSAVVVNKGGDQNSVTNTTINSDKHIDRTMELIPVF